MTEAMSDIPAGYRQEQYLGAGGWAQVYRCVDERDGAQVALKLFHQRLDDPVGEAGRFREECRIAGMLSAHPGIIRLRAAGIGASGRPWLVMDLAPNGTLADLLRTTPGRLMPLEQALNLAVNVADTLSWAHRLSSPVVHGDVKPANILLDATGRPLLGDFGVAANLGSARSVTVAQFTQTHAAPEVLDGRASLISDVWSLGATLFEMVVGAPPFVPQPHEGPRPFIERVHGGLAPDAIPATVAAPVADALRSALTVDRAVRTPTMDAFADQLRAAQRALGLPVTPAEPLPDGRSIEVPFIGYAEAIAPTTARPLRLAEPRPPALAAVRSRRPMILVAAGAAVAVLLTGAGIAFASTHHPAAGTHSAVAGAASAGETPSAPAAAGDATRGIAVTTAPAAGPAPTPGITPTTGANPVGSIPPPGSVMATATATVIQTTTATPTRTGTPTPTHTTKPPKKTPPATTPTTPPPAAPPASVDRTAITSYNRMSGGAPYWGRATKGWQAFSAQSNTLTLVGVTWSDTNYSPGARLSGVTTRISLCTGVGSNSSDPCTGRIADGSATVVNQGDTEIDFGDIAVTPGATYYVFYYQPATDAGSWDMYWWSCSCAPGRGSSALSDQNQAIVRGYNR